MDITSTIVLKEDIDIFLSVLKPELKDNNISGRADWIIKKKNNNVHIIVSAKDATAFRAAMNSVMKAIFLYERAKELK
jgi:tRNA threonylcarbamoyladenosine modification (KEOPS) complex  Pcc1 subunit